MTDSPAVTGDESDRSRSGSRLVLRPSVSSRRISSCNTFLEVRSAQQSVSEDPQAEVEDEPTLDVVRLEEYKNACKKLQAVPQSVILRNLGDRVLDLRHRNVGSRQLQPLFVALKENMRVQKLLLEEVGLDSHGAQSLADGLAENVTVSYLSLSGNPLGAEGLVHVVCLLRSNKIIQSLDLSGENTGLEFLRLAWNRIRLNGAAAIGQCLTGAVGFADGLKDNDVLQELDLSHNTIHWDAAQVLAKGLAKNSTLKILRVTSKTGQREKVDAKWF
nr:hypothetical protein BaRGS_004735 [Batillaria attramentaria]